MISRKHKQKLIDVGVKILTEPSKTQGRGGMQSKTWMPGDCSDAT